jgi:hypothetical protein
MLYFLLYISILLSNIFYRTYSSFYYIPLLYFIKAQKVTRICYIRNLILLSFKGHIYIIIKINTKTSLIIRGSLKTLLIVFIYSSLIYCLNISYCLGLKEVLIVSNFIYSYNLSNMFLSFLT